MVKRYDQHHHRDAIEEIENGDYVLHSDYDALAERCERLETALRDMVDRITYYAELKEEGIPNIEDWAYTYNSGDMKRAREALSTGAAP